MSWPKIAIDDIAEVVTKGTTPTTYGMPFTDSGVNFIKAEALNGDSSLDRSGLTYIDESTHEALKRSILQENDVLITIAGAQVGRCGLVRNEHLPANTNQAVGIIRVIRGKADPRFIYYHFKNPVTFQMCQGIGGQAAQPNINLTVLKGFLVPFPDRRTQNAVANILSAYDDLIENNRRRIALLEEAARLLYREWFVHFRFPGHEHVRMIDGVPERWEVRQLSQCVSFQSGGTPSKAKEEYWLGDVPWISSGELTTMRVSTSQYHVTAEAVANGSRYAEKNTILAVVRGMSLAREFRIGIVSRRVCFNQDVKALVPDRDVEGLFIFHSLFDRKDYICRQAGQASHGTKKLETMVLESLPIIVPPPSVRCHFIDYIEPMHALWDVLHQQNRHLGEARDLLLPRLMNGEIAV